MSKRVFIDTSAWIAYYLSDEPDHIKIKNVLKSLAKERASIFTSNDIIDETVTRLVQRTNPRVVGKFTKVISESISRGTPTQLWVDEEIQTEAFAIIKKFSEHKLSLTDATTIVLVRRFNIESVVTLDSDFIKVGMSVLP